jgi:hypothetical protein
MGGRISDAGTARSLYAGLAEDWRTYERQVRLANAVEGEACSAGGLNHKRGHARNGSHGLCVWLRMPEEADIGEAKGLEPVIKECDELCRIISASNKTPETRLKKQRANPGEFRALSSEL